MRRFLSAGDGPVLGKTIEVTALRRDGRQLPVELTIWATQTAAGWSFNSLMRDISERKALEAVRARYEAVFQSSGDAIVLVDPSGTVLAWNPAAEVIYGYASDEMLGRNAASVLAAPGQERARAEAVALLERGEQAPGEVQCLRKDGAEIIVSVSRSSIVDDEGHVVAVSSISRDVTDRRRAEAQLRDSEERFRRLASKAPIGIFQTDAVGRCTYANPTWAAICGVNVDVVPGREWMSVVHPDDVGGTREVWREALEVPVPFLHRFRAHRGDGEACWVDVRLIPLPRENGRPPGWVGTATDVTPVIEANVAIADARDRALQASQLKSQFLANMSHEIRTPMNGVVGTAELLSDSPLSDSQRTHVDALRAAASSLMAVLNDVLDFSKIEAGKLALDPATFHLPSLISDTVALFAATAQTKGIDLTTHLAPGREWLRGDASRIRQVLANLLGNAVKFTERGEVVLIVEESTACGSVRFSVVDSGIGIPDEVGARLMRPFEQGDASTTRRFGGSGLGLAICHDLVELMGGSISFTSIPGAGTTFTVELPLPTAEPADTKTPARLGAVRSGSDAAGHVLVAEDVPINQLVARGMLERLGWNVDVVGNGQAAVEAAGRGAYDVVILDCQMPVLDGYEAARAIRLLPGRSGRSLIIAMTANALAEDRLRCLDSGMDDYIAKPITLDGLAEVLHRVTHAPARLG